MHTIDLCGHLKFILGKILLDNTEQIVDILHSLEYLHRHLRAINQRMGHIEHHLGIPPLSSNTPDNTKEQIQVATIDSDS